jgi:hypothetical protein
MSRVGKRIGACGDLVGKSEEKKPLARKDLDMIILLKLIFKEWFKDMDWIDLA